MSACGCVSSLGIGSDALFKGLKNGIKSFTKHDNHGVWNGYIASAGIKLRKGYATNLSKAAVYFISALEEALDEAGLDSCALSHMPLIVGTAKSNLEKFLDVIKNKSKNSNILLNGILEEISTHLKINPKSMVISNACASGTIAIGEGYRRIKYLGEKAVICGGCDSLSDFLITGFAKLMALDSEGAKPFDKNRKGLTPGEGAAALILEDYSECVRRGATPLCEIIGYAVTNDANHITGPSRDGSGLAACMAKAMKDADITPSDIDFVNLHGTGTVFNDAMESKAVAVVFGNNIPCNSIKGAIGHTMGASGAIECVYLTKVIAEGIITPTSGFENQDDEIKTNIA
jgi:3-oxoacyl-(acyl-carrier-protein) synthase